MQLWLCFLSICRCIIGSPLSDKIIFNPVLKASIFGLSSSSRIVRVRLIVKNKKSDKERLESSPFWTLVDAINVGNECTVVFSVSHSECSGDGYRYPDTLGLVLNEGDMSVTATYSDHSIYKWDLSRLPQIGRISASLYHSSCVWSVDVSISQNHLPYRPLV